MKKKALLAAAALAALMVPQIAGAEGFGIVEWSPEGVAMGGARMFADNDAASIASNPANLTKVSGQILKTGVTYISPHGKHDTKANPVLAPFGSVDESSQNRVHPGYAPGTYYAKKMSDKDFFGFGVYSRFGMVSGRQPGTMAASNNLYAKMNGLTIAPTYAHKFNKKWSAAVGLDINYVGLEMNQEVTQAVRAKKFLSLTPAEKYYFAHTPGGMEAFNKNIPGASTHLKGESWALGWNAAVNYTFDDKNEMGVVYRSKIKHSLEADFNVYTPAGNGYGDAYGVVTLPDQWTIGYGHKFDDKHRVELNATRTNWHTYDALNIMVGGTRMLDGMHANPKNYGDSWRYAIGYEYKISKKYTLMAGFAWDQDSKPEDGGDFIVPVGTRRTYSIGARYNDDKHAIALALGYQKIGDFSFVGHESDAYSSAHNHGNYAKIVSVGYEYHF